MRPRKPIDRLPLAQSDGGRASAGLGPSHRDCVTRAVAIASGRPYAEVWQEMKPFASRGNPDKGVFTYYATFHAYMQRHGFVFTDCRSPTGRAGRVKLRKGDLPGKGHRLVVVTQRHAQAVIDGVVHDTHSTRTPSVRYYWTLKKP